MRLIGKVFALSILALGLFMVYIYFPESDKSVKVGFALGGIFALLGLVRVVMAFRWRN